MGENSYVEKENDPEVNPMDAVAPTRKKRFGRKTAKAAKKKKKKQKQSRWIVQVINGDILTRDLVIQQLPFIFFLTGVLLLYIGYGYYAQSLAREQLTLEKSKGDKKAELVTISSEYNQYSGVDEISKKLKELGSDLVAPEKPPSKILVRD